MRLNKILDNSEIVNLVESLKQILRISTTRIKVLTSSQSLQL